MSRKVTKPAPTRTVLAKVRPACSVAPGELLAVIGAKGTVVISRGFRSVELCSWKEVEFVIAQLRHMRDMQSAGKLG